MYHFANKEALLEAVIGWIQEEHFFRYQEELKKGYGKIEAYCRVCQSLDLEFKSHQDLNISSILTFLTLMEMNENVSRKIKNDAQSFLEYLTDDTNKVETLIIKYAIDGMMMSNYFEIGNVSEKLNEELYDHLLKQARNLDKNQFEGE